jgi:thiol-disulfide isomerase/thioredoxin
MKKLFLFFLLCISIHCIGQQATATKNASGDLIGITVKTDLTEQPYANWFKKQYDSYTVDEKTAKKLKKALKNITIKAFIGTWCRDSKREVPRLYKIIEGANFDVQNIEMIGVNRAKRAPNSLEKGFEIRRIPTFIFYEKGEEIGRYIEVSRESLEKDMLKIITKKEYKHSYDYSK